MDDLASWVGLPYVVAALVVSAGSWAWTVIAEGRRRVAADRRNPLKALERITAGRNP